jgi:hypothetical protein
VEEKEFSVEAQSSQHHWPLKLLGETSCSRFGLPSPRYYLVDGLLESVVQFLQHGIDGGFEGGRGPTEDPLQYQRVSLLLVED